MKYALQFMGSWAKNGQPLEDYSEVYGYSVEDYYREAGIDPDATYDSFGDANIAAESVMSQWDVYGIAPRIEIVEVEEVEGMCCPQSS